MAKSDELKVQMRELRDYINRLEEAMKELGEELDETLIAEGKITRQELETLRSIRGLKSWKMVKD